MRSYEDPTHVPVLPLKIIVLAYVTWFVVLPVIIGIRSGLLEEIPIIIGGGLTLVGFAIGYQFIHRLVLWFFYAFFWYLLAALSVGSFLCAATLVMGAITIPINPAIAAKAPTWLQTMFVPGAILGVIAIILVLRYKPVSHPSPTQPAAPETPPKPAPTALDQLEERRRKLGLK